MNKAFQDVMAERRRQIEAEGWTPEHDDLHRDGELAQAATCYIDQAVGRGHLPSDAYQADDVHDCWPWSADWWKPKSPRRDLVRAAALLLAEIERRDRAAKAEA